jgi:hypothetical protein
MNYEALHYTVVSILLVLPLSCSNIFLTALFSNTLNVMFFRPIHYVSHPYKMDKTTVFYDLKFGFLDRRQKDKQALMKTLKNFHVTYRLGNFISI